MMLLRNIMIILTLLKCRSRGSYLSLLNFTKNELRKKNGKRMQEKCRTSEKCHVLLNKVITFCVDMSNFVPGKVCGLEVRVWRLELEP